MATLLLSRRFAPLFWCQFFAAFNDNFLKTSLVFLILFRAGGADSEALITLASAIFIAPYFFLSGLGGELADRYDKARVAQVLKFAEIFVALIAVWGFAQGSLPILFTALAGFGFIAALFGPLKYGVMPDNLEPQELPTGNALIEGASFVAILLGTMVGGLAARGGGTIVGFASLVMVFAVACWLSSLLMPARGSGAPHLTVTWNIARSTADMIRHLRSDARLWWGAMVTSWFWLVGIVVLSLLPPLIKTLIGGDEETVTVYLALFSIAVGVGSGLAAWLARGRIELRITVVGAVLLGLFAVELALATWSAVPSSAGASPAQVFGALRGVRVAIDLVGLAIAGGLFIVPSFAAVQAWSSPSHRARTVAAVNVLNAAFMTGATVVVALLQKLGVTLPLLFLGLGVTTLIVAAIIAKSRPQA